MDLKSVFRSIARIAALGLMVPAVAFSQGAGKGKAAPEAAKFVGERSSSLEEVYDRYMPAFSRPDPTSEQLKFSKQTNYMNMADVQLDSRVRPIMEKANELMGKGEFRKATELYRRVLQEFPDELYQIAGEGIFIPASLYAQRRILMYPKKELSYYRILHDPAAKEIYERAVKRYSIFDYKDLARFHLATSYGDDALFALGNAAIDNGRYDEARRNYEQLLEYCGLSDEDSDSIPLDRDQVWVRLAICYKYLGRSDAYQRAMTKVKRKDEETTSKLIAQLEKLKYDEFEVRQREGRRSAQYDSMDDKSLSDPMPYATAANRGEWTALLACREWWDEPEARPWATDTDLIYKELNVLYSRSLLTGEPNWVFGPGGASMDWDRYAWGESGVAWYPRQSILVHDGVVFAHMFVYGPSLVAVDQYTGQLLWSKGPMAAQSEDDWLDRYQAAPAAGRGMIIAPIVHDDIRGRSHIGSTAELAAFETQSGKLLWRKSLARISPLKITQSRYPRKIRILSTTPLVKDGVIYHVTNAGVVAAVDVQTGDIRWLTRYPQNQTVLDNFSSPGRVWRNDVPLIRGHCLYVTPVDCGLMLCMDTETGRILWSCSQSQDSTWWERSPKGFPGVTSLDGFTSDGLLCLRGSDVTFLNAETGKLAWSYGFVGWGWMGSPGGGCYFFLEKGKKPPLGLRPGITGEGEDYWWPYGVVNVPTTLTRDGKAYTGMQGQAHDYGGPFNTEFTLDLKTHGVISQRNWYDPHSFIIMGQRNTVAKRVVNEEPEAFDPAARMTFARWGVPFELDIKYNRIVARYDRKKIEEVFAARKDLDTLFAEAEMARKKGGVQAAIRAYETCKGMLPSEEENFRRNINLRLYPLYLEMSRWGHQAADLKVLEEACRNMGATASSPDQEIRALVAYAELHEKRGDWGKAVQVLQNASRHYWRESFWVSLWELGDRTALTKKADTVMTHLLDQTPSLYAKPLQEMAKWERAAFADYFLAVANVDRPYVLETRNYVVRRLRDLLTRAPEAFRRQYEDMAAEEFKTYGTGLGASERLLWCWPETGAGRKKTRELAEQSGGMKPVERQAALWRLDDLAETCGFGGDLLKGGKDGLDVTSVINTMPSGEGFAELEAENGDYDVVRLALPQRGQTTDTADLLFIGGRKKSAYGNKFTVTCMDLKNNKKVWETGQLLLHGKTIGEEGYETGFEEVFIWGKLAMVHGRFDVIAFDRGEGQEPAPAGEERSTGKKQPCWHFRVPMGFEIVSVDLRGELLILCGRNSTVALSARTGEIVWDVAEAGDFYAGPYFHKDMVLTVRNSPSEVSFRRAGSGRLLSRLRLPGLTTNRKHPVYGGADVQNPAAAAAVEAYPVAFGEGVLTVVDGRTYHVVDVDARRLRWSQGATKLDPSTDPAYRFWVDGGRLFVLKPYYSVLENAVFDLASGEMLWRRREGGKKVEEKLKGAKDTAAAEGAAKSTGLVLRSMVFLDGTAYGIRYEMGSSTVSLVGMDPASGNEIMRVEEKGYSDAEAYMEPSWSKDCVTVRIQDGNNFELWQVDVKKKQRVQRLKMTGYGRMGEYGDVSGVWQGPYQALWTFEKRKCNRPAK